jgi:carbonic anhydrase
MKFLAFLFMLMGCSKGELKSPANHETSHWGYQGDVAPYHWGSIAEEYKSCGEGRQQSPINLVRKKAKALKHSIKFQYQDMAGEVENNGHSIKLSFQGTPYVAMEGEKFYLRQLHFHAKSEHALEGLFYPAELHIVHESVDHQLLVLGFFLELDDKNFDHYGFFQSLPKPGEKKSTKKIKLAKLINFNGSHFYYRGSLTTPPCTENVRWVIFDKHIKLSSAQLGSFESRYSNNYRPIVPLQDHQLFHSE